eukprot:TRINITY_DN11832_c0_g1_i1.p1 TRINITY_DN11832_c0_g1~~TRINITY_DN11832_c0_g1_i1.p1  ORF type:complete len:353 (+),score=22.21 TRINITY_DN11832_c0_g1_i1:11-1069(+)
MLYRQPGISCERAKAMSNESISCINGVVEEINNQLFCYCSSANWYGDECELHFRGISNLFFAGWIIHQILSFVLILAVGSYAVSALIYIYSGYLYSIKLSWRSCYTFVLIVFGCVVRCILLVDIWGFHGIYGDDFSQILYYVSYGLWGSALLMQYGIWWQIVIDSGKLKLNTHWMKAVVFMVVMSIIFGVSVAIVIPLMWSISDSLVVKGIIGYLVVGAIFLLLIASIPSGTFILLRMKKYHFKNKDLQKQTKLIVMLGVTELVFLLLAIAQTIIHLSYPDGTITGNYLTAYINWAYRVLDGILLFLTIYALCDSPLTMVRKIKKGTPTQSKRSIQKNGSIIITSIESDVGI